MATPTVMIFPDRLYRKLQSRARKQRRSLAQEVTSILEAALTQPEPRSILELRGLGKDLWREIDTDMYIEHERSSWN